MMLNSSISLNHLGLNNVLILSQYEHEWNFGAINRIFQRNLDFCDSHSRPKRNLHKITVPSEIPNSTQLDESLLISLRYHTL